jgi:hypothetical protein
MITVLMRFVPKKKKPVPPNRLPHLVRGPQRNQFVRAARDKRDVDEKEKR